jgi:phosphoribosylaminoimidazolecarboxamide formyltransferase / IMP cyclohydrolase
MKRALISVSDKTDLLTLGHGLQAHGVEIIASGGTAKALSQVGIKVVEVADFTGAPEILGGRVKTLHPRIHAGILADRRNPEHMQALEQAQYLPIDFVICNLYPFKQTLGDGGTENEIIEDIDIGGPTLVRAAAKNYQGGVTVVLDPNDYPLLLSHLKDGVPQAVRRQLASKAFQLIADYDVAVATWMARAEFPTAIGAFEFKTNLRYGENPQQKAALYAEPTQQGVAHGIALQGKELSYNNYLDLDAAYRAVFGLEQHACAIVKHTNPCGMAQAAAQAEAFTKALAGDPVSAFGGIIGFNNELTSIAAHAIIDSKLFVECIVAPGFSDEARALLAKRENLRLLQVPVSDPTPVLSMHRIGGGLLVQQTDPGVAPFRDWHVVTEKQLSPAWQQELAFAMRACMLQKSNAVVICKDLSLRGAGAGQMSRVDATEQCIKKAGLTSAGSFMASDAFFPFADCVELAAQAGIAAIIQPGGSKRDQESIDACNKAGIAMVFTGRRHFRH